MSAPISCNRPSRRMLLAWCSLNLVLLAGCATPHYRTSPQFEDRLQAGMTIAVMPPDVKVYEVSAGEVPELMDEWSETARKNVIEAVRTRLPGKGQFIIREFDPSQSEAARAEFEDAVPLFRAVAMSAAMHTYIESGAPFETKMKQFDYSLGPLPMIRQASGADAVLFIEGVDQISSGGRVARNVAMVLVAAAFGVVVIPPAGLTAISAALVDPQTGDVLWFNQHGARGKYDLRKPDSAESCVADAFEYFITTFPAKKPGGEMKK